MAERSYQTIDSGIPGNPSPYSSNLYKNNYYQPMVTSDPSRYTGNNMMQQQEQQMEYYYNNNNINTNDNTLLQSNNGVRPQPATSQTYVPDILSNEIKTAIYTNIPSPYTIASPEVNLFNHQVHVIVGTHFQNQVRNIHRWVYFKKA